MQLAIVPTDPLPDDVAEFDDFWLLYPKRAAKKDAKNAWAKLSTPQKTAALIACVAWRHIWAAKDVEFLPHPATWLNGERWEDELPSNVGHASHVTAPAAEDRTRGAIPEHVKALLAKLRK